MPFRSQTNRPKSIWSTPVVETEALDQKDLEDEEKGQIAEVLVGVEVEVEIEEIEMEEGVEIEEGTNHEAQGERKRGEATDHVAGVIARMEERGGLFQLW